MDPMLIDAAVQKDCCHRGRFGKGVWGTARRRFRLLFRGNIVRAWKRVGQK